MPEGDSIYRVAARLRPRLEGRALRDVRTRGNAPLVPLVGATVAAVESRGKHLLIRPESGPTLRVHLGMRGSWRRFEPGARWRRHRREASLILATDADVFACFRAQVEVLRGALPERAPSLTSLGPDLLGSDPDYERILTRAQVDPSRAITEVLLDQRIAAGIGNVYKSEVLFLSALSPTTRVGQLTRPALLELYERATRLLQANLGPGWRVTRGVEPGEAPHRPGEARHYVYRRAGRGCFRCDSLVCFGRSGDHARSTYWCPACQPPRLGAGRR